MGKEYAGGNYPVVDPTRWDLYFLEISRVVASKSKDNSMKVGAVLTGPERQIISTGYNDFPRGVSDASDSPRRQRPLKYSFTEHAERNCIYAAALSGVSTKGSVMRLSFEPFPCPDCARAVIQSGVVEVRGPNIPFVSPSSVGRKNWEEGFSYTREMFTEARVSVVQFRVT